MPKQIYEISNAQVLITFTRLEIDEKGEKNVMHIQTRTFSGLPTMAEVIEEAKTRTDEGIEVQVSEGLAK